MKDQLRVGVAQIEVQLADIEANVETHKAYIEKARQQKIELLVFPELSLTGYQLERQVPQKGMASTDQRLLDLAALCPDIYVICGFVECVSPGEYCNAAAWLYQGEVCFIHRKLNLPTYGGLAEGKIFTPGKSCDLQSVSPSWPAATLICADMWNPGLLLAAMLKRPSVLVAPINSADSIVSDEFSNPNNWGINLRYAAMTYGTPVVMANRCDTELEARFWGGSRILGPAGETLAQAGEGEELICADLSLEAISQARFDLPTIRDVNPDLIKGLI